MEFLHHYLVDHPLIRDYEWRQGHTLGSTPLFLTLTILTYLTLTLTLLLSSTTPPTPTSTTTLLLRLLSSLHNLTLSLLSLLMAIACTLSTIHQMPKNSYSWIICFPANHTPPRGPMFFWAHVFYFSKILEFLDTLFIVLSGSKTRRLSFLHVYHHAVVVIMCYLWLTTSQTLFPVALVTNAVVHVLMYAYYFLSGLGIRPRWKKLVTNCQIVQFVFSFLVSGVMLYYHFSGENGCSGIWGWCFNAVFNASLLALFVDFHSKNYDRKRMDKVEEKKM